MSVEERRKFFVQAEGEMLGDKRRALEMFVIGVTDADQVTRQKAAQWLAGTVVALQQLKRAGQPMPIDLGSLKELRQDILTRLNDPDRDTRGALVSALAYSDAPSDTVEAALLSRYSIETDDTLKAAVLQTMASAGYESERFGSILLQALNGSHEVQISAAEAVAKIRPKGALPILMSMLERREGGGVPVIDAIAAYGAEARPYLPQLEKLIADPSISGDLRERVRQAIEEIKNPTPEAKAEPRVKAVALVNASQPQAPAPTATPAPASAAATAPPAPSSPTPAVAESPVPAVEHKSSVWPWLVGIAALIVIVAVALKRRA
jgi:hypothetical protein